MEHKNRGDGGRKAFGKGSGRFWGLLGALWLMIMCLAGCGALLYGDENDFEAQIFVAAEESEIFGGTEERREVQNGASEGSEEEAGDVETDREETDAVEESGSYTSKDEVALYLHLYGRLPDNYITKKEAENLGWDSRAGNLWEVAPGMSIGGSRFGNYEGLLPDKKGRKYYECDVDYEGGYRGAARIVYSDDGLIYYTEDHYKTFEQLYGQ